MAAIQLASSSETPVMSQLSGRHCVSSMLKNAGDVHVVAVPRENPPREAVVQNEKTIKNRTMLFLNRKPACECCKDLRRFLCMLQIFLLGLFQVHGEEETNICSSSSQPTSSDFTKLKQRGKSDSGSVFISFDMYVKLVFMRARRVCTFVDKSGVFVICLWKVCDKPMLCLNNLMLAKYIDKPPTNIDKQFGLSQVWEQTTNK